MTDKVRNVIYDDEIMQGLFQAGFITTKVFLHRDIYLWITTQIKVRAITKNKAVIEATEKFKLSEQTIWTALKTFK